MSGCCEDKGCALEALRERQRGILRTVLWINAAMFGLVLAGGIAARSTALLSDSLDNLGDALTYALTLYAVSRSAAVKARVAAFKGFLILGAALFVVAQIAGKLLHPTVPVYETMGWMAVAGLAANTVCLALLWKHRGDDVNMSSVWECSRNDIAANVSVLLAAAAVRYTGSGWPDLVIGSLLVALFLRSALRVLRSAFDAARSAQASS
jgi:Co/Zn/Cd efflux system component